MSANSKRARKNRVAKDWSAQRKSGGKGPARTTPSRNPATRKAWFRLGNKRVVKKDS